MMPLFPVQGVPYCYVVIVYDKQNDHIYPPVFFIMKEAADKYLEILKKQKFVVTKLFEIPASASTL